MYQCNAYLSRQRERGQEVTQNTFSKFPDKATELLTDLKYLLYYTASSVCFYKLETKQL